jgi:hypothetical protein
MNAADTTCGNPRRTLLSHAAMPLTFAVRAERVGGLIPTRAQPAGVSDPEEATELSSWPRLIAEAVLDRCTS